MKRVLGVLVVCGFVSTARAQTAPARVEIGMDAALSRLSSEGGPGTTVLDFPAQSFRLGFELSLGVTLEPTLGLHGEFGDGSFTQLLFDLGLPINFSSTADGAQFFVRPLAGLRHFSSDNSSATQFRLGGGVGVRVPIVTHLMSRFEARYAHDFKGDNSLSLNEFSLVAGLSFFTR